MTDKLIARLKASGCDTAGALNRLGGDGGLYIELLNEYMREIPMKRLCTCVAADDISGAFETAHSMKGVLGNLGLTPMYLPACSVTEKLRHGQSCGDPELHSLLESMNKAYAALIHMLDEGTGCE